MTLENFHSYMTLQTSLLETKENLNSLLALFSELGGVESIEAYSYSYKYNQFDFFYPNEKNEPIPFSKDHKKIEILIKNKKSIFGKLIFDRRLTYVHGLQLLFKDIKHNFIKRHEIEQQLFASQNMFDISIIHDNGMEQYAQEVITSLKTLFNVKYFTTTSLEEKLKELKNRKLRHILIYIVKDEEMIKNDHKLLESINEFIIVIGPHDVNLSMMCGKLGIQRYFEHNQFELGELGNAIIDSQNKLISKGYQNDKIITLSGITGGIGTTTLAMNSAHLLATHLPNKNVLYVDLATTKAISNLFLSKNPIPSHSIIDLVNEEFDIEKNLNSGLYKVSENFFAIDGIQRQIDKDVMDDDHFVDKLLTYLTLASKHFNYIIIDAGIADASHLKTMVYDLSTEIWLITQMTLPHISIMKTFYILLKRAGMKEKTNFLINRYDSNNAISIDDVISILNLRSEDKISFDFRIKNDYKTLGYAWNYCELANDVNPHSPFVESLLSFLQEKNLLPHTTKEKYDHKSLHEMIEQIFE